MMFDDETVDDLFDMQILDFIFIYYVYKTARRAQQKIILSCFFPGKQINHIFEAKGCLVCSCLQTHKVNLWSFLPHKSVLNLRSVRTQLTGFGNELCIVTPGRRRRKAGTSWVNLDEGCQTLSQVNFMQIHEVKKVVWSHDNLLICSMRGKTNSSVSDI